MTRPRTVRQGVVIVALAFAAFAVAGCGSSSSSSSGTTTESSGAGGGGQKTIARVKAKDPGNKADAKVTVTIPASGAVSFYCKFHKSEGMAGALAVEGQGAGGSMPGSGGTTTNNTTTGKGYGY